MTNPTRTANLARAWKPKRKPSSLSQIEVFAEMLTVGEDPLYVDELVRIETLRQAGVLSFAEVAGLQMQATFARYSREVAA